MKNKKVRHLKSSPFLAPFMSKMIIVTMHISERDFAKEFINKNIKSDEK
jgi:hypothetical protein